MNVTDTTDFKFSHRATGLPGGNPETDRVVVCGGRTIGRVFQVEAGQQKGLWQWSCFWIGADTHGTVETLEEGLEAIKSRVTVEALQNLPPGHSASSEFFKRCCAYFSQSASLLVPIRVAFAESALAASHGSQ